MCRVTLIVHSTIVIGAGQAGLAAAYHLAKRGIDFLVLDANPGPGGAWQHRWDALTLGTAHHIHPLPDFPLEVQDSTRPASQVVSEYYAEYERRFALPVRHGAPVTSVTRDGENFVVHADAVYRARTILNATGTWTNPFWPVYPGPFDGPQVHTNGFRSPQQFAGQRVLVVGAGASATQFIVQLRAAGVDTLWSTRRAPDWREEPTGAEWGLEVERQVNERTSAGLPPKSVVGTTGLLLTPAMRAGIASGALVSRGKIEHLESDAVVFTDGSREKIDAILWATGFRHAHRHLRDLKLHTAAGGILLEDGVAAVEVPGLFFVGYGASASTLGATRAGRKAALAASKFLSAVAV